MTIPSEDDLTVALTDAVRRAVYALRRRYPEHQFYYISLTTTAEGHAPVLTAWSKEALVDATRDDPANALDMKWSYADSPFYGFGEEHFATVRELIERRDNARLPGLGREAELRLRAMERALAAVDAEGAFGRGKERFGIVVNAEVMPPDSTNVERARRLNPPAALDEWLAEAAEPE